MQDDFHFFGNGKSSKTTKKNQHHKSPSGLGYPKPEGEDKGESYTLFRTLPQKRGACLLWRTRFGLLPFVSSPIPHAASPRVHGAFLCCSSKLSAEAVYFSLRSATTKIPTNRRKTRFVGSVSYPNVEKGAIRNRRARAHAPQRHRVRPRPYHLPWRSGVRHRRRP